jgi:hypothetical protein
MTMGGEFMLTLLFLLGMLLAIPAAGVLVSIAYVIGTFASPRVALRGALFAACLPFAFVFYMLFGFFVYWATCDFRGVDPGIGDWWMVPIHNGYSLEMINGMEQGYISRRGCLMVDKVTALAQEGPLLVGKAQNQSFVLSMDTGIATHQETVQEFGAACREAGLNDIPELKSVEDFYGERRASVADPMTFLVIVLSFPFLAYGVWRRFIRPKEVHPAT